MKSQLIQYVDLLFAGAADSEEIKQEILQNTLDRYDDLISQGKSPEAAYRLAITGIGDVNEILGNAPAVHSPAAVHHAEPANDEKESQRKELRAGGIFLYIISALPLILLSEFGYSTIGLAFTIILVAVATYIMIITSKDDPKMGEKDIDEDNRDGKEEANRSPARKLIEKVLGAIAFILFFGIGFTRGIWHPTWLVFPAAGLLEGLIFAIMDLMEGNDHV